MKTYKLLYPLLPFLLLAACDNATNGDVHTDAHRNVEIYDDNDTMRDYEEVINRRTADDRFGKILTDSLYHENLERDRSKMYADIGMSAAEIEQFEENYRMRLGELKTHGLGNYTLQDLHDLEDESMKTTLTDPQYRKYLELKAGGNE